MPRKIVRHRAGLAIASAIVVTTTLFGGTAVASPNSAQASTPVPVATPDGYLMSYVVNTKVANPGQTQLVEKAVVKAGGVVIQAWPEIGVVVAHSDRAAFRSNVVAFGGNAVESIGASRTAAVSEGTPDGLGATWGKGASGYKKEVQR